MKKRLFALVLALVMMLSVSAVLAESEHPTFTPTLLPLLDLSAADWCESADSRATLAVLMMAEYGVNVEDVDTDPSKDVFVALAQDFILTVAWATADNTYLLCTYAPERGHDVTYLTAENLPSSAIKTILENNAENVYTIPLNDLAAASESLLAALSN